ncbi:hypothetical protein D3C80_1494690 [compost metagenome]
MLLRELEAREPRLADLQQCRSNLVHIADADLGLQQPAYRNILPKGGIRQLFAEVLLPKCIMLNRVDTDCPVYSPVIHKIRLPVTVEAFSVKLYRPFRRQLVNPCLQRLTAVIYRYRLAYIKRNDFHSDSLQSAYSS